MYLKRESSYISGLTNIASSCSKRIGLSYVEADCYSLDNYKEEFKKTYRVKEELVLEDTNQSLKELLISIFGEEDNLIEGLLHWINLTAGSSNKVLTPNESSQKALNNYEGIGTFYFLEDIFFIECEKMVICLLIGNDE